MEKELRWGELLRIPKGSERIERRKILRAEIQAIKDLQIREAYGKYYGTTPDGDREVKFFSVNSIPVIGYELGRDERGVPRMRVLAVEDLKPEIVSRGPRALHKTHPDFK